jgi:hypothetical protein
MTVIKAESDFGHKILPVQIVLLMKSCDDTKSLFINRAIENIVIPIREGPHAAN